MKKMTGAEFKAFMKSDWDALLGVTGAYVDDSRVTVDGVNEPEDTDTIPDTAKVEIHYGCIMANEDVDLSFEAAYIRWKKKQTTTIMCIEVPNEAVEALLKTLAELKGKVHR